MLDELYRFIHITREVRLLHLPPSNEVKPLDATFKEKASLMQVRLDLESKLESEIS